MDRIAVRVSNEAIFAKFLSLTDKEYVDVFFSKNQAFAVNNSSEVFGYLPLACAGCSQESLISCRVSPAEAAQAIRRRHRRATGADRARRLLRRMPR